MQEHHDLYNIIRVDRFAEWEKFPVPCRSIEKIFYTYEELDWSAFVEEPSNAFEVSLWIQGFTYREIVHYRDINLQSLVGNSGGYIGLLLGYTLLQMPDFVMLVLQWCKSKLNLKI